MGIMKIAFKISGKVETYTHGMNVGVGRNTISKFDGRDAKRPNISLFYEIVMSEYFSIVRNLLNDLWSHPKGSANNRISFR